MPDAPTAAAVPAPAPEPTWRPDGGPEAWRTAAGITPEILHRFRAHRVCGGHQKWPDQTSETTPDGWYVRPQRKWAEQALGEAYARFKAVVADPDLFDLLCLDDGRCGGADWRIMGRRVTSTSIWSAFYACRISELCPAAAGVVDLGGGYGHLAGLLARFYSRVTLVELPEVLRLAREYVHQAGPMDIDGVGIPLLRRPDDDWNGDLLVNTMSFQHMTPANLAWYDARIRACPPRWIYLVNRTQVKDPTDTVLQDYPFLPLYRPVSDKPFLGRWREFFGELRPGFGGSGDGMEAGHG